MMQHESLRIVEQQETTPDADSGVTAVPTVAHASYYEEADGFGSNGELALLDRQTQQFIPAVMEELGIEYADSELRKVDELGDTGDVEFAYLLVCPDETLLFVGSDPTARDAVPLFAFTIGPTDPLPAPDGAQDALDLLKPPDVQDAFYSDGYLPTRQGEWWLMPTDMVPVSTIHKPGVSSRPYGPSPLGNHVPREYGFTVSNSDFLKNFRDGVPQAPESLQSVPEVINWTHRQLQKEYPPEYAPAWDDIRAFAGDILVRGTLRHRENDHFVENAGDEWHKAITHDMDVYTGDGLVDRVRLD